MAKVVVITGAAGRIAYSLLPSICNGSTFGSDTRIKLRLIDIESAKSRIEGLLMEIQDCAYDLLDDVTATCDANEGFSGAHYAILLGIRNSIFSFSFLFLF
jgi:malate/lactate dehydrogenase